MTIVQIMVLTTQAITLVGAFASLVQSLRNSRQIQEVHLTMNSRMDALLATTRTLALSEGAAIANAKTKEDAADLARRQAAKAS